MAGICCCPVAAHAIWILLDVCCELLSCPAAKVVVALCCAGLVLLSGLLFCLTRACGRPSTKVAYGQDVGGGRQPPPSRRGSSGAALPRQPTPSAPQWGSVPMAGGSGYSSSRAEQGVAYDERTGQFIVQGRPYGAYNFDAQRGYYDPRR